MRDIPMFTTQCGVASLILNQIPYTQQAYIRMQTTQQPRELIGECVAFCRACGAEAVFAFGEEVPEDLPVHMVLVEMCRAREGLDTEKACLFPVLPENIEQWREIYNQKMAGVPGAFYMDTAAGREMLQKGDGYFVHRDGVLLGIGRASEDTVDAVAAVQKGAGETVLRALCGLLTDDVVRLKVAESNLPALRLYERLGFCKVRQIERWQRVL